MMLGGRYRLLEVIGRGGIGVVHRAEDTRLRRKVALKILAPDHVASEERRRRFVNEARIVAGLSHPNIAVSYDAGEDDAQLFLVMELLEGETLRERIERDSMPVEELVRI